ncbi:MAG: helix-turn-helix domain-containing protein, partial [Oscillospiraceae bacterium]
MSDSTNDYTISSVQRALKILKLFVPSNDGLTLMDISNQSGVHKSTALRMVSTLKDAGFLKQSPESKKYRLGVAAMQVGLSSLDSLSLPKVSEPILRELADKTGFAVHLGIFESGNVIVLAKVFPVDKACSIRLASKIGG